MRCQRFCMNAIIATRRHERGGDPCKASGGTAKAADPREPVWPHGVDHNLRLDYIRDV